MAKLRRIFTPAAEARPIVLLSARNLAELLTPKICFDALLQAYRDLAEDPESSPKTLGFHVAEGNFHIKAGIYPKTREAFAAKLNANFPGNSRQGLPTIQGLVLLIDAINGTPLAIMDSGELTARRTAAAAALAASFGARRDSKTATFIGCGRQAGHVLEALLGIFPLRKVFACDLRPVVVAAFVRLFKGKVDVQPCPHPPAGTPQSGIIVTCTTAKSPVLWKGDVPPGTFIAAVGADNPEKQELKEDLFSGATILVDDRAQCAKIGDLAHALKAGTVKESDVHADLCELASGRKKGRCRAQDIVIFDSTGTGLQDVAAARAAWRTFRNTLTGVA